MEEAAALRTCTRCGTERTTTEFSLNSQHSTGRHPWCKQCQRAAAKARYHRDPAAAREAQNWRSRKHRYGISQSDYEGQFHAQGGRCAICGESQPDRRLSVDHDHACCPGPRSCGQCVRDLLCVKCNSLLGLVSDNQDRLLAAVSYLRKWSK